MLGGAGREPKHRPDAVSKVTLKGKCCPNWRGCSRGRFLGSHFYWSGPPKPPSMRVQVPGPARRTTDARTTQWPRPACMSAMSTTLGTHQQDGRVAPQRPRVGVLEFLGPRDMQHTTAGHGSSSGANLPERSAKKELLRQIAQLYVPTVESPRRRTPNLRDDIDIGYEIADSYDRDATRPRPFR